MSVAPVEVSLVPPAFHTGPEYDYSRGGMVADFSDALGFVLDPEQRLALDAMYAATGPGATYTTMSPRWATMETAVIAPRQNLKTGLAKPAALADCLLFGAPAVLWTAHRRKTAMRAFKDVEKLIEANAWLSRYVRHIHRSTGSESIEFTNGNRIEFVVRSEQGARGESNAKLWVDEALYFTAEQRQAIQPTMAAIPNPMIAYLSSPGLEESAELRLIRDRGRNGDPTMAYLEWASRKKCQRRNCRHELDTPGCVADDEAEWYASNPALGRRISIEFMRSARRSMATKPEKFLIEHMGHWPEGGKAGVIPVIRWSQLAGEDVITGPVVVTVDVSLDRQTSWIAVCGATPDGTPQVEIADTRPGTEWVADRVRDILARHEVVLLGARNRGAVSSLIPDLRGIAKDTETEFRRINTGDFTGMCGLIYDAVYTGQIKHRDHGPVTAALKDARRHKVVDAWEWEREKVDTDAAPLVAVTGAFGLWNAWRAEQDDYDVMDSIM